jgi:hypothetical protein
VRALIAAATLLVACGDNIAGLPFIDFEQARRTATCSRLVRCGLFDDVSSCEISFRKDDTRNERAAIDAGKLVYDPIAAARCVQAIANQSCDTTDRSVRDALPDCANVLLGTVADGAECGFDAECISGHCNRGPCPRTACCTGTCAETRPPSGLGEHCINDTNCQLGMFCGRDLTCHLRGGVESRCDDDMECEPGLGCTGAGLEPGFCRPLALIGQTCLYARCAEIQARCNTATLTCVKAGVGARCLDDSECNSLYGRCDLDTNTCTPIPTLGMPCEGICRGAAWCDSESRMCLEPKPDGNECGSDAECASRVCAEGPAFDYCATPPVCI